jgi:hypothetical protein
MPKPIVLTAVRLHESSRGNSDSDRDSELATLVPCTVAYRWAIYIYPHSSRTTTESINYY